jgi:hypothetical protein
MMEEFPGVIVPAFPSRRQVRPAEDKFLRAVGACVNGWAFVDRRLFELFRLRLQTATELAAHVYYKNKTLGMRVQLTGDVLETIMTPAQFKSDWKPIEKLLNELIPVRNIIVHSPVRRTHTSDGKKPVFVYEIYIEPYEQLIAKDPLRSKTAVGITDLKNHESRVEELHTRLLALVSKVVRTVRANGHDPSI